MDNETEAIASMPADYCTMYRRLALDFQKLCSGLVEWMVLSTGICRAL
jgi:hypothetical protein